MSMMHATTTSIGGSITAHAYWSGPKGSGRYRNVETGLFRDFRHGPPHRGKWQFVESLRHPILVHPSRASEPQKKTAT